MNSERGECPEQNGLLEMLCCSVTESKKSAKNAPSQSQQSGKVVTAAWASNHRWSYAVQLASPYIFSPGTLFFGDYSGKFYQKPSKNAHFRTPLTKYHQKFTVSRTISSDFINFISLFLGLKPLFFASIFAFESENTEKCQRFGSQFANTCNFGAQATTCSPTRSENT